MSKKCLLPSQMEQELAQVRAQRDHLLNIVAGRIAWEPPAPMILTADGSTKALLMINEQQSFQIASQQARIRELERQLADYRNGSARRCTQG